VDWIEQQQPEALRRWIRDTSVPVLASLPAGEILWVNQAFEKLLGYTLPELNNLSWKDITANGNDIKTDVELARQTVDGEREEYQFQKEYIHKDRSLKTVRIHVLRHPEAGEFQNFLVTVIPLDGYDQANMDRMIEMERQLSALVESDTRNVKVMSAIAEAINRESWMQQKFDQVIEWSSENPVKALAVALVLGFMFFGETFKDAAMFARQIVIGNVTQQVEEGQ
jgi:PAS domain S-box-containing protein